MKKNLLTIACIACLALTTAATASAQTTGSHKILIAYFSWSGNSRAVAEQIADETGGTLFEIKTVHQYPSTYDAITREVQNEQSQGTARPALAAKVSNMAQYDTVFLGWPCWWGTMPMAVCTFLESYNFAGKTIYPFTTHGGSGFGSSLTLLKKEAPQATIKDGLAISAFDTTPDSNTRVKTPDSRVTNWVKQTGLEQ